MEEWFSEKVLSIEDLSENVKQFRLSYRASNAFLPGQFVMLELPIESAFTTRSYSIASAPNGEGYIDLCIVHKTDGAGSGYLFNHVKVGDNIIMSLPQGKFLLEDLHYEGLVMVSTGTGIAPFRSMIRALINQYKSLPFPLYLVFGNRTEADMLYRAEWEEIAQEHPHFHFIPVLSRSENWAGAQGYVHEHYQPIAQNNPNYHFYLCGWSDMVKEAKNHLREMGFSRKQVKFELYD